MFGMCCIFGYSRALRQNGRYSRHRYTRVSLAFAIKELSSFSRLGYYRPNDSSVAHCGILKLSVCVIYHECRL